MLDDYLIDVTRGAIPTCVPRTGATGIRQEILTAVHIDLRISCKQHFPADLARWLRYQNEYETP